MKKIVHSESGIYLVLLSFLTFTLVMLVAMVIGLAEISSTQVKMQGLGNYAALAALEDFSRDEDKRPIKLTDRQREARDRAVTLVKTNKIAGLKELGNISLPGEILSSADDSGKMIFGKWYRFAPTGNSDPCGNGGKFPCFGAITVEDPATDQIINAVRVEVKNQSSGNPMVTSFFNTFGASGVPVSSTSTAAVVQRCAAFVLDVSFSSVAETHNSNKQILKMKPGGGFNSYIIDYGVNRTPKNFGFAFIPGFRVQAAPGKVFNCYDRTTWNAAVPGIVNNGEPLFWCSLTGYDGVFGPSDPHRPSGNRDVYEHFLTDYILDLSSPFKLTPYGPVWVDRLIDPFATNVHYGPEPLSRFYNSFNVALRQLVREGSSDDRGLLVAFRGYVNNKLDMHPREGDPEPLEKNLQYLVQLTNVLNRGTRSIDDTGPTYEHHPNFIDKGWFPIRLANHPDANIWPEGSSSLLQLSSGTNIVEALTKARNALADTQFCPPDSQKIILLASDGISSCSYNPIPPAGVPVRDCAAPREPEDYVKYKLAEKQLLFDVLPSLKKSGISLSVMLDGENVGGNFINRSIIGADGNKIFLDSSLARSLDFKGFDVIDPLSKSAQAPYQDDPKRFFETRPGGIMVQNYCQTHKTMPPSAGFSGLFDPICPFSDFVLDPDPSVMEESDDVLAFARNGELWNPSLPPGPSNPIIQFRRPNGVLGHMVLETGGQFCPLLDPCDPNWYEDPDDDDQYTLMPVHRIEGTAIKCPAYRENKNEQAARCALEAIGLNPYVLVDED